MNKIVLPSLVALGLMSGVAFAQTQANFAELDTDVNGELSYAEIIVAWPDLTQEEFDAADVDVSGGLSVDELGAIQGATDPGAAMGAEPVEPAESLTETPE